MTLLALSIDTSPACQICFPIPRNSAADHLIAADAVVLARENPDKPFSLKTVEVLKGDGDLPPMDLFLDSQSRRVLAAYPEREIVCVYRGSGAETGWQRVGLADEVTEPLMREVLKRAPSWEDAPKDRLAFFAPYLGHEHPQVGDVAHIEVARAPYDEIVALGAILPREELHAFLGNFRYIEWHALYILLLAQTGAEEDHRIIADRVHSAAKFGTTNNLAAWATAWIEVAPEEGMQFIEAEYLQNPARGEDEVKAVLPALSVHGTRGHTYLRERIVAEYRHVLEHHPALAAQVVGDLETWERWDLGQPVASAMAASGSTFDGPTTQRLRAYVGRSQQAAAAEPSGSRGPLVVVILVLLLGIVPVVLVVVRGRGGGFQPPRPESR